MDPQFYTRGCDDEIQTLKGKLAETSLLLEVLAKVNFWISKSKTFEEFCSEVAKILSDKLKFRYIYFWLRDEKDPTALRLFTPHKPEEEGNIRDMTINMGIIGKCIRANRTICAPDVTRDPDYLNANTLAKSELCVPLCEGDNVIGALNIETDTYQTFEGQIPIIEIIAENLAHSLRVAMLYRTDEQFHGLVENMNEGVWVGNAQSQTVYTNPALRAMTHFSDIQLLGKTITDYLDEDGKNEALQATEKLKKNKTWYFEANLLAKDDEKIPVLIHLVPFGNGGAMATITDLRAVKSTEKKLFKAERFLSSIMKFCPEAIVGLDADHMIQSWNAAAEQMFGYKTEEILGRPITLIIPGDRIIAGERKHILNEIDARGLVKNFETARLHKNGNPVSVSLTASAVKDEEGKTIGLSLLYRDITAQKKWERELQDKFEKMQEAYREMGKQRRYLDYLIDIINIAASGNFSEKQITTFVVNAIVIVTKVNAATLRILDPTTNKLVLAAQSGVGEDWWSKKVIPYAGSLLESAVSYGQPLKILDIFNNPRYPSPGLARKNNLRSALVIPLQVGDNVLGSLVLYLSQESDLNLLDDEFITVFAKQASLALRLAESKK